LEAITTHFIGEDIVLTVHGIVLMDMVGMTVGTQDGTILGMTHTIRGVMDGMADGIIHGITHGDVDIHTMDGTDQVGVTMVTIGQLVAHI
jgi:hypothetical protein